jgi:hypothetical protein
MTDSFCYIRSSEYAWIPATLLEQDGDVATVSVPVFETEQNDTHTSTRTSTSTSTSTSRNFPESVARDIVKVNLNDYPGKTLPFQNVDENGSQIHVADLTDLMFLNEVS